MTEETSVNNATQDTPARRTLRQNKALHKGFALLAERLNESGLEMRAVLKPDVKIWWTPETTKEHLYKPLEKAMYGKRSTTELSTTEISKVWEQLNQILGEKYGVENVEFPSVDNPI